MGHHPQRKGRDLTGLGSSDVNGAAGQESWGHRVAKGKGPDCSGSYKHKV